MYANDRKVELFSKSGSRLLLKGQYLNKMALFKIDLSYLRYFKQ